MAQKTMIGEKKWKRRAFPATARRVEWLDRLVSDRRTCWRRPVAKQCLTRRRVNFSTGPEIGACGHVERYFPTRIPPEGRSDRGTLVGVLVSRNGGRWKKLTTAKYYDAGCGLSELTT